MRTVTLRLDRQQKLFIDTVNQTLLDVDHVTRINQERCYLLHYADGGHEEVQVEVDDRGLR